MSYFRLAGADGPVQIPEAHWYMNTKHRARRIMQTPLSSEAQRIYACLELATMGYSQELAVTMSDGKKRVLTSADLMRQTGLKAPNVDRGLRELEAQGFAERRPLNPDIPLQKGNIGIYSWAVPQEPKAPDYSARDNNPPAWMPATWTDPESTIYRTLKRFRINPSPNFHPTEEFIEVAESAARDYKKAEDCLVAHLRSSAAGANGAVPSLYVERNGKEHNNNSNGHPRQEPAPEQPAAVVVAPVLEELQKHGSVTEETAQDLLEKCRRGTPGCTPSDVVETIQDVAATFSRRLIRNPVGVLLTQVPKLIKSRPKPRPVETQLPPPPCPRCQDTGFLDGFRWDVLPNARAHLKEGATACTCDMGQLVVLEAT